MRKSNIKETKFFTINDRIEFKCLWIKTSYGFKHEAYLRIGGHQKEMAKYTYYNRTWESYEYESVLVKLIDQTDYLTPEEKELCKAVCSGKSKEETAAMFKSIAMIAKIGEVLTSTPKDANEWKKRMLATTPGLEFPADFDSLPEEEKTRRLNGAIEFAAER